MKNAVLSYFSAKIFDILDQNYSLAGQGMLVPPRHTNSTQKPATTSPGQRQPVSQAARSILHLRE